MAKDSKLKNIGDSIIVSVSPIAKGIVTLSGYTDELLGVTLNRSVQKQYRIKTEDLFDTGWQELTNENLSTFSELIIYSFSIEVKYTRTGTDTSGEIEFVRIDFQGVFDSNELNSPAINKSIFKSVINDSDLNYIENNFFKKLYKRGIIPTFVKRGENDDKNEDLGFFSLFSSISKFFALLLKFIFRFDKFNGDYDLMLENVKQMGLSIDDSNVTLEELQFLSENYYDEIRKRGTLMILKRKGKTLTSGKIVKIDGELIRLFRNQKYDELLGEMIPIQNLGWCLGHSSPMYKGTTNSKSLNKSGNINFKGKSDEEIFNDFILTKNNCSVSVGQTEFYGLKTLDFLTMIVIPGVTGFAGGFGRIANEDVDNKLIPISTNLDYEITFFFRKYQTYGAKLKFAVEAFDYNENKMTDALSLPNNNGYSDSFFDIELTNFQDDEYYFVRGIIYGYASKITNNLTTNIGYGNNLMFSSNFVKYILPKIIFHDENVTPSGINQFDICNYNIKPLIRGTNVMPRKNNLQLTSQSLGFLQSSNLLYLYIKNNNNTKSVEEIEEFVNKYLIPYNVNSIFVYV